MTKYITSIVPKEKMSFIYWDEETQKLVRAPVLFVNIYEEVRDEDTYAVMKLVSADNFGELDEESVDDTKNLVGIEVEGNGRNYTDEEWLKQVKRKGMKVKA